MQEAVRKARQLMYQRKLNGGKEKSKAIVAPDSRDNSAIELKEFLEIESSIRGYGSAPPTGPSTISKTMGSPSGLKPYFQTPQSIFLKRVAGEHIKPEDPKKMIEDFLHSTSDQKKQPQTAAMGASMLTKAEADARATRGMVGQVMGYNEMCSIRKSIQKKAANFSPVVASRKNGIQSDKNLEELNFTKNPIKISASKKGNQRPDHNHMK